MQSFGLRFGVNIGVHVRPSNKIKVCGDTGEGPRVAWQSIYMGGFKGQRNGS